MKIFTNDDLLIIDTQDKENDFPIYIFDKKSGKCERAKDYLMILNALMYGKIKSNQNAE